MNLTDSNRKIIAIDFDGTIVEHKYPEIGKEMIFAFATLKALKNKGHRLILWTYRNGKELDDAVQFCKKSELLFYAVNENYPGETSESNFSRKINADIFIDDRNVGGFLGWDVIWQILQPGGGDFIHKPINLIGHNKNKTKKRSNWISFFLRFFKVSSYNNSKYYSNLFTFFNKTLKL